jgi:hypothetical protein
MDFAGLAAEEIARMHHLRDFRSPAIFEFFNTIGTNRTSRDIRYSVATGGKPDMGGRGPWGRFGPNSDIRRSAEYFL